MMMSDAFFERDGPHTSLPITKAPTKINTIDPKKIMVAPTRTGLNIYTDNSGSGVPTHDMREENERV